MKILWKPYEFGIKKSSLFLYQRLYSVYSLQYTITVIHTLSLKLYTEELTSLWNFTWKTWPEVWILWWFILFHQLYINIILGFQNCDNSVYTFLNQTNWYEIFCNKIKMLIIFNSILISLIFLVETDFAPIFLHICLLWFKWLWLYIKNISVYLNYFEGIL